MILDLIVLVGYLIWIFLAVAGGVCLIRWVRDTYKLGKVTLDDLDD